MLFDARSPRLRTDRCTGRGAERSADERTVTATDRATDENPGPAAEHGADDRIVGQGEPSFLSVMDGIAGGGGIEFNPPRLDLQIRPAEFD